MSKHSYESVEKVKKAKVEPETISSLHPNEHLICWDFDGTIVNGHFHNLLYQSKIPTIIPRDNEIKVITDIFTLEPSLSPNNHKVDGKILEISNHTDTYNKMMLKLQEFLNNQELTVKNPELLKQVMNKLIEAGFNQAITTFASYPEIIPPTLRYLGIKEEDLSKFLIVCNMSKNTNKNAYITKAMQYYNIADTSKVSLIDDTIVNIVRAKNIGCKTFHVAEDNNYLVDLDKHINYIKDAILENQKLAILISNEKEINNKVEDSKIKINQNNKDEESEIKVNQDNKDEATLVKQKEEINISTTENNNEIVLSEKETINEVNLQGDLTEIPLLDL